MDTSNSARASFPWRYAVAGVCSALVLFTTAQAISGFFSSASAPMVALGSTIIDFTPAWLKDWAIGLFGTNDKLFLFITLGVVAAALAGIVGLVAKRSMMAGSALVLLLAAVLAASVMTRSSTTLTDLVPTALGTVLGLSALRLLTHLARKSSSAPEAGSASAPDSSRAAARRHFLLGTAGTVVLSVIAAGASQALRGASNAVEAARSALGLPAAKVTVPELPKGEDLNTVGVSRFITPNEEFYRIDTALSVPRIDPQEWVLKVHGMVENEFTLTFDELLSKDLVEHYLTLTCVSNPVGGDLVGNAKWLGYPLRELLKQAVPLPGADMVLSTSQDGFSASTPLEVLTDNREALLAIGMNDEPLPLEHGFPVRMVVPGLYGYVSATKWVVDLEVTRFQDKTAYWTTRGWSERGPIKMSSRIETPRSFANLPAGKVVFGGTAWAQTTGIARVELRIDDGPWQEAELSSNVSADTWRQWRYEWNDATSGSHSATVRATDANGELQADEVAPPAPDGSSGWHRLQFSIQ
ncbi:DMSO/TMAO reductase YedYZ molybdopterin-dependent catalytic subunit [Neomicrococcus aestuarii]|uniref:DMSO/TMAO reductase YedYZ molybdopterin-dependent catalytic subunit n=1 Tax=Neomicrococcus aestuarii TaxID=556325 RepID=A0A7W8TTY7_9MICC|nr:molybdopterin-dependent oxidoreductase [Neomicrococcus aestuarii]MBB5512753.1 DMSO/TMAO reductase YedYZ molybdopterin-dependent catalytic subunit [Neomicrococcus aestuarii]